ncbi:MAG: class I SAM-dependent methyltransferase [Chloroflexota bacterium]|nr:class I SAM-dependent methyltransferase [Chloroflexota bacterium]
MTENQPASATTAESSHGYNPQYSMAPFTTFSSVTPKTELEVLNLNWREQDLPERIRTKHVHRLHPYLGKFVPQLAEIFLRKYEPATVCDPFCGSGTALVEAVGLGINAAGCDISSFNTLMSRVKTDKYDLQQLEFEIGDILNRVASTKQMRLLEEKPSYHSSEYLNSWFAPPALKSLIAYRELIEDYQYSDVLRLILSRSARSARLTTHFDLDFPKYPQTEPYYCYKHRRTCKPTENSAQFLKRYSRDTLKRIREYSAVRRDVSISIINGDTRKVQFPECDLVVTSPPYVGLIDYHAQHRYSYELLGLEWKANEEIGAAEKGGSLRAQAEYVDSMVESFENVKKSLSKEGRMVVIVNDKHGLYEEIQDRVGMRLEARLERHVNRRTGRRAGDFFESVLIWTS